MSAYTISSGLPSLDEVLQGLRLGDNVVWQVDSLEDYKYFVDPFLRQSLRDGRRCVYLRFAEHEPVARATPGLEVVEVDPSPGFDVFSREVHRIIEERGKEVFYILDNLSALVAEWATDELLANFFQVTCPYLFELDTVTYFALTRGKHAHNAVARIRDTTQLLIDVYRSGQQMYIHPIKVWDRYSPQMFLPHVLSGEHWQPIFQSGEAAAVSSMALTSPLKDISSPIAPWNSVYARLTPYRHLANEELEANPDLYALKQELCHMLTGSHPEFSRLADRYFTLNDLLDIRDRMVGSGRIGGKAAGMLAARRILATEAQEKGLDVAKFMEPHDSFYIGSDVFFTFLVNNDLFRLRLQMTRNSRISHEEFEKVEQRFLAGKFPSSIMDQFRNMLDYYGQAPLIVRSSSLLEDSFGNAFAGKYRSEFCANQGGPDGRLEAFLRAVKLVYASALNPDALSYRRKRGLGDNDEQMAILVQRVSGMPYRHYFFPSAAGVAFSRNLYAWNDRIDPKQGMIRLVFGMGTRAVDRVGGDYPRMIAVSHPQLRPEVGPKVARYSQRHIDVLDLKANALVTLPLAEVLEPMDYPNLHLYASTLKENHLSDPVTRFVEGPVQDVVLTFNNLIRRTSLVQTLGAMLGILEEKYERPIDTEFTASLNAQGDIRINLLQCRPLFLPGASGSVSIPAVLPEERILFKSDRMICGGEVRGIRYIVFIDPEWYHSIRDPQRRKALGRLVGQINELPAIAAHRVIMMGPGRWGSSNIDLGVNVGFADIDNAPVLVEIAREEAGHVPEVSYGTHFFLDLVENQIIYLPVYPDETATHFNKPFFHNSKNALLDMLPEAAGFEDILRLIDIPACSEGLSATVLADPHNRQAVCFLE
ncbi:MAG: PEP/pyruvate-binding domain-containing protein [Lentisphaerota bacterium]